MPMRSMSVSLPDKSPAQDFRGVCSATDLSCFCKYLQMEIVSCLKSLPYIGIQ